MIWQKNIQKIDSIITSLLAEEIWDEGKISLRDELIRDMKIMRRHAEHIVDCYKSCGDFQSLLDASMISTDVTVGLDELVKKFERFYE